MKAYTWPRSAIIMYFSYTVSRIVANYTNMQMTWYKPGVFIPSKTGFYKNFGPLGMVALLGINILTLNFLYKTGKYFTKMTYNRFVLGEKNWVHERR